MLLFLILYYCFYRCFCQSTALQWRHYGRDSGSNHQPHLCLLNRLFGRRSFPAQMASNTEKVSIWWRHHRSRKLDCLLMRAVLLSHQLAVTIQQPLKSKLGPILPTVVDLHFSFDRNDIFYCNSIPNHKIAAHSAHATTARTATTGMLSWHMQNVAATHLLQCR